MVIPAHSYSQPYTHLAVYTSSSLVEQTTPQPSPFIDSVATVVGLAFTDLDLDQNEFGGSVSWSPPPTADIGYVSHYLAYKATGSRGQGKLQLGTATPRGTNQVGTVANIPMGSYTHIVVYTRSLLVTTYVYITTGFGPRKNKKMAGVYHDLVCIYTIEK